MSIRVILGLAVLVLLLLPHLAVAQVSLVKTVGADPVVCSSEHEATLKEVRRNGAGFRDVHIYACLKGET